MNVEQLSLPSVARSVVIDVRGLPRPQGSLKLNRLPNGKTTARYPAPVYQWRGQVQQAVAEAVEGEPFRGAVRLDLGFDLPRPLGHMGTGRNAGMVKLSAPAWPTAAPDLDKLVRCIGDAITDAGLWLDDGQVVCLQTVKRYVFSSATQPGVLITVTELL